MDNATATAPAADQSFTVSDMAAPSSTVVVSTGVRVRLSRKKKVISDASIIAHPRDDEHEEVRTPKRPRYLQPVNNTDDANDAFDEEIVRLTCECYCGLYCER